MPFSCYGDAQQLYTSLAFSGPVYINSITFFHTAYLPTIGSQPPISLDLSLSTSPKSMTGLSSTYSDNLGADDQLFFSGTTPLVPAASSPYELILTGSSPFYYDPSAGNLLLSFKKTSSTFANFYWDVDFNNGGLISRAYDSGGGGLAVDGLGMNVNNNYGIVTRFDVTPASIPAPEPASMILLATGLAAMGLRRSRRRP